MTSDYVVELRGHDNFVFCVDQHHSTVVTGSFDETVKIWDLRTGGTFPNYYCVHRVFDFLLNYVQFDLLISVFQRTKIAYPHCPPIQIPSRPCLSTETARRFAVPRTTV